MNNDNQIIPLYKFEIELKWSATPEGARGAYLKIYLKGLSHRRTALILEARANSNNY